MLKIKDNVDLKSLLENLNFRRIYIVDSWAFEMYYIQGKYKESIIIWENDRTIQCSNAIVLLHILYDLIKADLVEKVSDGNE